VGSEEPEPAIGAEEPTPEPESAVPASVEDL